MSDAVLHLQKINQRFDAVIQEITVARGEISLEIAAENLHEVCLALRDEADFKFELLVDVCVVDYAEYGISEWTTERSTLTGFERGVDTSGDLHPVAWTKPRFGVVYHLLSLTHNQRLRLRVFAQGEPPQVPSIIKLWPAANWYEREAFDLYGVFFSGHPDLRRLLTDYGFVGHPFRKDFPLTGHVEVRYDATEGRVIYQPVTVVSRTLVPKTIRKTMPEDTLTCFHKNQNE
ncbi:NADH-quinone oxidoreductase subunit C [Rickettsiella endosymbiont of Aleochara curtula]|jgi:NADH-quinone oxidoreductase subunit C|uniref:NADH-quinone oxidoreductase subunit C n=1 Tax=Rickettsiella endosymbiont of Aleochara curtula TaxID=3077936 RepID=UPI00313B6318